MQLINIFVNHLNKQQSSKPSSPPIFKIKPSSLGSPCLRKVFYSSSGVEEDFPFPLDGKKRMKLGDAIHHMLYGVFKAEGIIVDYKNPDGSINVDPKGGDDFEFPITFEDLFIKKGKIDLVCIIDGKLWLGEYKSINQRGFDNLTGPKSDHLIQGITYLYLFNQHLQDGKFKHIKELDGFTKAEGIRFLYINKDSTDMREFPITNADDIFKKIVEKIMLIRWHYDSKVLPPKTKDYCNSCNFRTKCEKNQIS